MTSMPMASHDQNVSAAPHFNHPPLRNYMVPLMIYIHIYIRYGCIHPCMYGYIYTCTDTNCCIHAYIQRYVHAYNIYVCAFRPWYLLKHEYIILSHTFQPRNMYDFRVKNLHSFQICIYPVISRFSIPLEMWKFDNFRNTEILQIS